MKSIAAILATACICLCVYYTTKEICKAWITVEAMKVGAPIFKTQPKKP